MAEFSIPRDPGGLNAEIKARRVSVLFGYPNDFHIANDSIVQTFYPSVGRLPFVGDFLQDRIKSHAFSIDKTLFYSHLLETLLNTPDNPGQIIFDDGSTLKVACKRAR